MPKPKVKRGDSCATGAGDPRFANFETDPRFRLPSKKHTKVTIDKRFAGVLRDSEFTETARIDRYGRKIRSDAGKKALRRLYRAEEAEEGEIDNEEIERELQAALKNYDPARGGGFESSSEDEESDGEEVTEVDEQEYRGMQRIQDEVAAAEEGDVTKRIAILSLDWDNIKSVDLFAMFQSFLPAGGRIEKVSIYPSEFGKQQMALENASGPPREIWRKKAQKSSDSEVESDEDERIKQQLFKEQEGNDQDYDMDRLREYQLDRLKYFYAVMVLSDSNAAKELYDRTDGTELLSSSNHLDLRFVPDDVIFDDEPRDECDRVPANYKPIDFTTRALNHSKVELTWDMDPEDSRRSATLKKVFTGSRADINENDLRAYLGSDSEDEDEDEGDSAAAGEGALRLGKKELARRKMREALGLSDEPTKTARLASGPVGDMQITFTPALSETAAKNKDAAEETTIEKYMRKERERKARKRGEAVANRGVDADGAEQDAEVAADMGFDDPFFASEEPVPASKSSLRKEERLKKRAAKEAEAAASAADRAKLEAILADDGRGGGGGGGGGTAAARLDHFNMRAIERAEKRKGKKKQGKGKKDCAGEGEGAALQQAFELDVEDPRFQAIFTKPEFAIDPSNPRFKATQGMKKLLDATRKKRKAEAGAEMEPAGEHRQKKGKIGKADDLGQLVHAVRKKATKM